MSEQSLESQLQYLERALNDSISSSNNTEKLDQVRVEFLGKKGKLTQILKGLGKVSPEERASIGKKANELKAKAEGNFEERKNEIKDLYYQSLADKEFYDVTAMPSKFKSGIDSPYGGHLHPISSAQQYLESVFTSMGFSIIDGHQVETDYYNFKALNFTDDHPAREMQDTFYTKKGHLLRTHTSSVQVRALKKLKPPMRIIAPGRVFRYEEVDASHEHTFYQMEGMIIDKEVSISNLLYLMSTLLREVFDAEVEVRLRPGYFPFVEPGFELDMRCLVCNRDGCSVCKQTGWVEVLPCGLVHPNVLRSGGLDSDQWQGAAFGLGLNRLVMMNNAIEDIRHFQSANPDFLKQF